MNKKKAIIYIIAIIIIIAGVIIVVKNRDKSNYKLMLFNKYNITETKYNELKTIGNKTLQEIEKQNMECFDVYYAKESNFMVARGDIKSDKTKKISGSNTIGPGNIESNYIYLEVTETYIETFKPEDTVAFIERASTYFTTSFDNAKNDTMHKDFIYFQSIDELKDLIK